MEPQEVLSIHVHCEKSEAVEGKSGRAQMIYFTGEADSPAFHGRILPGGIDTQLQRGGRRTLSARYLLEGTDAAGRPCRIFIENNAVIGPDPQAGILRATPHVLTDSPALQYLETSPLTAAITPEEGGIRIVLSVLPAAY